jgi:transposase InsO family protein
MTTPTRVHRTRAKLYPANVFQRIADLKRENARRTAVIIHRLLEEEFPGECPSESLVRKYLVAEGLTDPEKSRAGYVKFTRNRANDLWQIDIAGVQTVGHLGKLYLFAALDDHSRFAVAARYCKDQKGINVLRLLRDAFMEYGRPNQLLADNGTQFKNAINDLGTKYSQFLDALGVEPIYSRIRHPQTKGKLERWFGTVIRSFLTEARFYIHAHPEATIETLNTMLQEWVHWYNFEKRHRSLPGRGTPASAYLDDPGRINRPMETDVDWDRWFLITTVRVVSKYNTISYKKETIQLPPGYAKCKVSIAEIEGRFEVYHGDTCLASHDVDLAIEAICNKTQERKVNSNGIVKYHRKEYNAGSLLAGKTVTIRETCQGHKIAIYFNGVLVKEIDKKT